ncbi:pentatricopeptide repeat-containing protein At5g09450, mitochondrial [Phoenix dactylifera]|uniref:Pentatricopeptide repeat-containing protein At5g09450, mitochondrial n=1 Tax=Phoenix dactylifera TaxID=42345 RepID=A0A8B7D376_PHODC|nr:pentatricopeptide repeat-containing protein At5g09450, mitochondrial [Phoenix dactylifera]
MATGSLLAGLLRRSCHGNPRAPNLRALPFSHLESLRCFSSGPSRGEALAVEEEPTGPPDDLRSRLFRLRFPKRSATAALDKWVGEGRKVTTTELRQIAQDLKRSQRYKHALEISEWMKTHQESELSDSDYAMRIDLVTKVFGVNAAEDFFQRLPPTAKSCEVYMALLHSYAAAKLTEKAEDLFEKIKESDFSASALSYNEMMTLYMSVGQLDKVSIVVEELKSRKVSPDLFTYNLWISASAATMDIDGVRRILDEMAHDSNSDKDWITYRTLADIYVTAGHLVNSDFSLVEADAKISQREWITYDFLIILHAGLGKTQRINEIWKSLRMTSQKMTSRNYICILSSYLMLGQLKEAGEVIDEWRNSKVLDFDISACNRLFDAFMKAGLVDTAETFQGLMLQKNCELRSRV